MEHPIVKESNMALAFVRFTIQLFKPRLSKTTRELRINFTKSILYIASAYIPTDGWWHRLSSRYDKPIYVKWNTDNEKLYCLPHNKDSSLHATRSIGKNILLFKAKAFYFYIIKIVMWHDDNISDQIRKFCGPCFCQHVRTN